MISLDTSAIIDFLRDSEAYGKYFRQIRERGGIISAAVFAELIFTLRRTDGPEEAAEAAAILEEYPHLSIANVTPEIATFAGALRDKYYHRTKKPLSYIDCINLATAVMFGAKTFVTADADFDDVSEISVERYR